MFKLASCFFQIEMATDSSHADVSRTRPAQTFRGASHLRQETRACELTKIKILT